MAGPVEAALFGLIECLDTEAANSTDSGAGIAVGAAAASSSHSIAGDKAAVAAHRKYACASNAVEAVLYANDVQGLWRQPLNEQKPQLLKGFEEVTFHRLAWSFDGKELAYTSGPISQEIILIQNFK